MTNAARTRRVSTLDSARLATGLCAYSRSFFAKALWPRVSSRGAHPSLPCSRSPPRSHGALGCRCTGSDCAVRRLNPLCSSCSGSGRYHHSGSERSGRSAGLLARRFASPRRAGCSAPKTRGDLPARRGRVLEDRRARPLVREKRRRRTNLLRASEGARSSAAAPLLAPLLSLPLVARACASRRTSCVSTRASSCRSVHACSAPPRSARSARSTSPPLLAREGRALHLRLDRFSLLRAALSFFLVHLSRLALGCMRPRALLRRCTAFAPRPRAFGQLDAGSCIGPPWEQRALKLAVPARREDLGARGTRRSVTRLATARSSPVILLLAR